MEVWDSSRIPRTVVRQASPTVKPVEARLTLSCRYFYVIFFGPKGHFVMNKYLYYWIWNLVIMLLLYVWFEHPVHTYGGFVPSFSERGMTNILCDVEVACIFVRVFWSSIRQDVSWPWWGSMLWFEQGLEWWRRLDFIRCCGYWCSNLLRTKS
jgi:hypothetical protein